MTEVDWFGPTPTSGEVRCEIRFDGFHGSTDFPAFRIQWIQDGVVWAALRLVEACFPKGPLGRTAPADRAAFLRDRTHVAGVGLSSVGPTETRLSVPDVAASNWLPGTIEAVYGTTDPERIAHKDHLAARVGLHPRVLPEALPYTGVPTRTRREGDTILVQQTGPVALDLSRAESFWADWFGIERWPVADLYYGLIRQFVGRVILEDAEVLASVSGRPMLLLANHQTMLESLWFSILSGPLVGRPVVTLAKAEHRTSWLGGLIHWSFSQPNIDDPELIRFFDRSDRASLPAILAGLGQEMVGGQRAIMVHVEGTRALECTSPVEKMTGAWIDLALAADAAVVPVRFTGGLPRETLAHRLDFPASMGRQDVWIGRPLDRGELESMTYGERKQLTLERINGLGPPLDGPLPGDPAFATRVETCALENGLALPHAVLRTILSDHPDPCEGTRQVLAGDLDPTTAEGAWLAELAQWVGTR